MGSATAGLHLGLRENLAAFSLLVLVNAFVGAMAGLERSILPALAEQEFHVAAATALLSFIAAFGLAKALSNYAAGRLCDRIGRRRVLIGGWLVALPVPLLLMLAPSWNWVVAANVLLGISQGLTWSATVIMKIDLVGPRQRGLAMGLNEFAGYLAVAGSAFATGWVAATWGLRPQPFYLGVAYTVAGLGLSVLLVRETRPYVAQETRAAPPDPGLSAAEVLRRTSFGDRSLSSVCQTGLVNNLNDAMAWGLFPLLYARAGFGIAEIGALSAIYPAVWGCAQIATGALSDRIGRKGLIVGGMVLQAVGIVLSLLWARAGGFVASGVLLGLGTAMVYPTLLAAVGDVAHPSWRASAVGVYRLWRDLGYVAGALIAGLAADALGLDTAVAIVAGLTLASGLVTAWRMSETRVRPVTAAAGG